MGVLLMAKGRILQGDARKSLQLVEDESTHLVVTSPPYNVGIGYDVHEDEMTIDEWEHDLLRPVFSEAWRTLAPGGRMAVNIAHGVNRDPCIPAGGMVEKMLIDLPDAIYRGGIVWYKRNSVSATGWGSWESPSNPVLRGTFEMVYVVGKGRPDRPDREGRGDLPKGDFMRSSLDVWEIAPYSDHRYHPAPFPVELVRRLIQFYTWPGDHVLDPFAGSGTTAVVAEHLGRDWTMCELSETYCASIAERTMVFDGIGRVPIEKV